MNVDLDLDLEFSREQIKDTLINDVKIIPRNGEILDMEPFPSPHALALLASAAYSDDPVDLPEGWKHLSAAFNRSGTNDYFGVACWSPRLQQVVISHRGTKLTSIGHLQTNLNGVLNTQYTPQMNSAVTFADVMMSLLCEVNQERGVGLRLSLTGHSLGGWIAQVTAFTLEYARRDGDNFVRIPRPSGRHVHAVTFDTPGCGDMLRKIIDDGYRRHGETASLDDLDITNYLASPNRINTTGSHVGTIYEVSLDVSEFCKIDKYTSWYNIAIHKIDNFVKAFESEATICEVLDWPSSREEFSEFFVTASHATNFVPDSVEEERQQKKWIKELRYKTRDEKNSCNTRVFSEKELYMLDLWSALKAAKMKMNHLTNFVKRHNLGTVEGLFADFKRDLDSRSVTCRSVSSLQAVIRHAKQLMRWFHPEFLAAVERQSAQIPGAGLLVYRMVTRNYLNSLPECRVRFKDTIGLDAFLESSDTRILHIKDENSQFQVARLYNLLSQMRRTPRLELSEAYLRRDRQTFVDLEQMRLLDRTVDFESLYESGCGCDDLLVIDSASSAVHVSDLGIFERFLHNGSKKLIIISSPPNDNECLMNPLNVRFETVPRARVALDDLAEESQRELSARKMLIISGKQLAFEDYTGIQNLNRLLSYIDSYVDRRILKEIVTDQKFTIKMDDTIFNRNDLRAFFVLNTEVSVARVARVLGNHSRDALLVVSGIGREDLGTDGWRELVHGLGRDSRERIFTTTGDGESEFKRIYRENPYSTVYWLAATTEHIFCKTIHERGFYLRRRYRQIILDLEQFAQLANAERAIFVFQNVNDKESLMSQWEISEEDKNVFLKSEHIKTAASAEEANGIIKGNPKRPVHVLKQAANGGPILWQRSRGSLEGLRPYVSADIGEAVDEKDLCSTSQEVVIIAGEPGMGKSTSLASVSRLLESAWTIRIDLKDARVYIEKLPIELTLDSACEFLLKENFVKGSVLHGLLRFCLDKQQMHSREVYLLFDGFDEIVEDSSSINKNARNVLSLFKYLRNETASRLWITTRLYRRRILENELSTFAVTFEKIGKREQCEYLAKFWRCRLLLELDQYGGTEEAKLEKCAESLYARAKQALGDDIESFTGVPLQMRMLAEIFTQTAVDFVKSDTGIDDIFEVESMFAVYKKFITHKYDIYFNDKTSLSAGMSGIVKDTLTRTISENHRSLGLRTLFPQFAEDNSRRVEASWAAELSRVGLVQSGGGGREDVEFVHRTLAEYFCADLAVDSLNQTVSWAPMEELLFTEILLQDSSKVVRMFINYFILSQPLSKDAQQAIALKISQLWDNKQHLLFNEYQQTALHVAVEERNVAIVDFLIGGPKSEPAESALIAYIAAHNEKGETALGVAARKANDDLSSEAVTEVYKKIMEKIVQSVDSCPIEFKLQLLLATYVTRPPARLLMHYLEGQTTCSDTKAAFVRIQKIISEVMPPFLAVAGQCEVNDIIEIYNKMENDTERYYLLLAPNNERNTVLHLAAQQENNEIFNILCNGNIAGVGRSYDRRGETPLHYAASNGQLDVIKLLVNHGVYVDSRTALFKKKDSGFTIFKNKGSTALTRAADMGHLPVVKFLVNEGADINSTDKNGKTALILAAEMGCVPMGEFLVEKGADINCIDKKFRNALSRAAYHGQLAMVEFLLEKGADIKSIDKKGRTPLIRAVFHGHLPVLEYLLKKGADINATNNKGRSALARAARYGHLSVVEFLVAKGADINSRDKEGWTALSGAAFMGHLSVLEFLVKKGVDINYANKEDKNALFAAATNGHLSVVEFLVNKGAGMNSNDKCGQVRETLPSPSVKE